MRMKNRTPEQWRKLFIEQLESGEPVTTFCKKRGVNVKTFYAKRIRLTGSGKAEPRFVEVTVPREVGQVTLELANGRRLLFGSNIDLGFLQRVIKAMEV